MPEVRSDSDTQSSSEDQPREATDRARVQRLEENAQRRVRPSRSSESRRRSQRGLRRITAA